MSRSCSLDTQTGRLFIIIRKNKKISHDKLLSFCRFYSREYSFIEHVRDIDPTNGEVESIHYHLVLFANNSDRRLSTHLNEIVKYFKFDNANGIQIERFDNYAKALQYLTHQNYPDKTQHDKNEITTNIEAGTFNALMETDSDVITFDYVWAVCKTSQSIVDVIKTIGIKGYHRYRSTINDIWQHKN